LLFLGQGALVTTSPMDRLWLITIHRRRSLLLRNHHLLSAHVDEVVLLLQAVLVEDASHISHVGRLVGVLLTVGRPRHLALVSVLVHVSLRARQVGSNIVVLLSLSIM